MGNKFSIVLEVLAIGQRQIYGRVFQVERADVRWHMIEFIRHA